MGVALTYILSRRGKQILRGNAKKIAAYLDCSSAHVYHVASGRVRVDEYEIRSELVADEHQVWSPKTSETLTALRRRRASETDEPKWEL